MPIVKPLSVLDPDRFDLAQLSPAERLWTWRHRQKTETGRLFGRSGSAMNQAEAAAKLGIGLPAYRSLELGGSTALSAEDVVALIEALGPLNPTTGELCFLARRRSGETLTEVLESVGVSRMTFLKLERAGDPSLVRFWESRGYRFPVEPLAMAG